MKFEDVHSAIMVITIFLLLFSLVSFGEDFEQIISRIAIIFAIAYFWLPYFNKSVKRDLEQ